MQKAILGLLAETPVHPGAGRSMGVVDLPVAREAATSYPVLVGSSLKGALRDKAEMVDGAQEVEKTEATETTKEICKKHSKHFGKPDHAGDLIVADGRLLLLPVRSLTGTFRWVTCPHLIERYCRDLKRAGLNHQFKVPTIEQKGVVLASSDGKLFLEERQFEMLFLEERQFEIMKGQPDSLLIDLVDSIKYLVLHQETQDRLQNQIAILHDDDFAWFVRYGLSIQARNVLAKDGSKKSENLWYEETLPPDTIMYAIVAARKNEAWDTMKALFPANDPYLQVGGNETVGQGWFAVRFPSNNKGAE